MMHRNETHVMLLTGPGAGAIAVVRIAGPGVSAFLRDHFGRPTEAGRCVHGELRDGPTVLDDVVVARLAEDAADINLHGGTWIVRAVMDLAARDGFAVASSTPEEPVPLDAVDGDDLLEREMLAALPLARTERATRELLKQPALWRDQVARGTQADRIIAEDDSLWRMLHPPTVAIAGAANAGKSTLANRLFGQERSITADVPGTTRDWVGDLAEIDGLAVHLIDTPGLRTTADPIEAAAIALAEERIAEADLVVLLLDAARPDDREQKELLARFPAALTVMNKMDMGPNWHQAALPLTAADGRGLDALRAAITRRFGIGPSEPDHPRWWTERQRRSLAWPGGMS